MNDALTLASAQERFLTHHNARNHSERQIQHYERTFLDFDRFLEATDRSPLVTVLTTQTIEAFTIWLRETPIRKYRGSTQRAENGIKGHLKDIKAFVRWCADPDQAIVTWPVKVYLPQVPKVLFPIFTEGELVRIFASRHLTGTGEYAIRNRALVAVLLDTGIRVSEAAMLTPKLIIGKQYLQVMGKGHKERAAPFSTATLKYLEDWLAVRAAIGMGEDHPLFDLTADGIKNFMKRLTADVGLHAHSHKFRHQAATMLVRASGDLHAAKRILGHANLSTVEIYLSYDNDDLIAKHAAASPMAKIEALLPQAPAKRHRWRK